MLPVSEAEILAALANAADDDEAQLTLTRVRGRARPEKIAELRAMLEDWPDSLPDDEQSADDDSREFGGLIALYQID